MLQILSRFVMSPAEGQALSDDGGSL